MAESYLGIVSNGNYGLDTVGLGVESATGLTSKQNVVAGILTEPFYLGQFGLKPSNTTIVNGTTSFMQQLKNDELIPSLSYGYTAGAMYSKIQFCQVPYIKLTSSFRATANLGKSYAWRLRLLALRSVHCELPAFWQ